MAAVVDMFSGTPFAKPKRKSPRVMAHFVSAGMFPDGEQCAEFKCKCGWDSGLIYATNSNIRRGIPCEKCNDIT